MLRQDKIKPQLENLENFGLIDLMYHGLKRWEGVQHPFTPRVAMWQKWIRF